MKKWKVALGCIALFVIWITLNVYVTQPVDKTNMVTKNTTFYSINQFSRWRGDVSYGLYTDSGRQYNLIASAEAPNFEYTYFCRNVKPGQSIQLTVSRNNPFTRIILVSLVANGKNYISVRHINDGIKSEKIVFTILISIMMIIPLVLYLNERELP